MIKTIFTLLLIICQYLLVRSQNIGIGTATPNTSAALDITNTSRGLLIPRMTSAGINAISNPAKGLMVYDSLANQLMVNMGTTAAPNWQTVVANSGWGLTGNGGINPTSQFIGTTDNQPLRFRINNVAAGELNPSSGNVYLGVRAGLSNTTGYLNNAFGTDALKMNTTGYQNTANGYQAMYFNTTGMNNIANGVDALYHNTTGIENTATGFGALFSDTSGSYNTATGGLSLHENTTGTQNTANGYQALYYNTTAIRNTANGFESLYENTTGSSNTASGFEALYTNKDGGSNTALGVLALSSNSSGSSNTSVGAGAMINNYNGYYNTAIGANALFSTSNAYYNTVVGYNAGSHYDLGYNNTILGANCDAAFADAYNDIAIGQGVTCTDNSQARIGNSSTSSIGGYANWTNISDGRYKKNLKEDVKGLEFIMKLRPVTYNLDITALSQRLNESRGKEVNVAMKAAMAEKEQVIQTGFVAQEVEQAAAETGYKFSGVDKPKTDAGLYGLRYAEFVVPLVKAVQEQQLTIQELKRQNAALLQRMEKLESLMNAKGN